MWKWIVLALVVLLAVGIGGFFLVLRGPDVSKFEYLKQPRITFKPDTLVLEVPFQVNSAGLSKVFGVLMKTYYQLPGVPKGPGMSAPAARYENMLDVSLEPAKRAEMFNTVVWNGSAALALPVPVHELPASAGTPELTPRLSTWKYGEVAEILHIGPYADEPPTIKKLTDYLAAQGYEISGLHEEEYLRGPGMPFSNPKNYYTIIRYPVKKKSAAPLR
jgi:hypothetical protein